MPDFPRATGAQVTYTSLNRRFFVGVLVASVVATSALAVPAFATETGSAQPGDFSQVEGAMRDRVKEDGLNGGALLIAATSGKFHEQHTFGKFTRATVIPIASASKWLTSATVMTLVDQGKLQLDDPISKYLPVFTGKKAAITIRQALSHTSGLPPNDCAGDPGVSLAACVKQIAAVTDSVVPPGTAFRYTSVGFVIVGRIIEKVTGMSFEEAFDQQIARTVGMNNTEFVHAKGTHPDPAGSATSNLDDYANFVQMLARRGLVGSRRVLSEVSVNEIERDQVTGIDTHSDFAVQITHIPTYGLGVWRDKVGAGDEIQVVSGSGAYGFYPWIDRVHGTYGIVAVADTEHGSEHAVPASQRIAQLSWAEAAAAL
jgi:serine-type D-Ala-D-Ala carboxypeptidase/endopeptidase